MVVAVIETRVERWEATYCLGEGRRADVQTLQKVCCCVLQRFEIKAESCQRMVSFLGKMREYLGAKIDVQKGGVHRGV